MRHLMALSLAFLSACGDGDGGEGTEVDAGAPGIDADAPVDADIDDPDAAPACGRQIDPGDDRGTPRRAVLDETYLYVADDVPPPDDGPNRILRVWRYHRERGEGERLAAVQYDALDATNHRLLIDGDSLYASWDHGDEGGGLLRVPIAGGESTMITRDGIDSVAVDETHIYWATTYIGAKFEPTIKRRAKAGGDEEILLQTGISFGTQLAIVGDNIFFNDDGISLRRMPRSGGAVELVAQLGANCGSPCIDVMVAGDDGFLYWANENTDNQLGLFRSSLAPSGPVPMATDEDILRYDGHLFLVNGDLYWSLSQSSGEEDGIRRVSVQGGPPATVHSGSSLDAWAPSPVGLYIVRRSGGVWVVPEQCEE